MPSFKVTQALAAKELLKKLGIKKAFDDADFSGLADVKPGDLYISGVFHQAFVEVNEEGTTAAAATGVTIALRSLAISVPPVVEVRGW